MYSTNDSKVFKSEYNVQLSRICDYKVLKTAVKDTNRRSGVTFFKRVMDVLINTPPTPCKVFETTTYWQIYLTFYQLDICSVIKIYDVAIL